MSNQINSNAPFYQEPLIHILWDASPLWGHFVLNAVIQTGISYSLIRTNLDNPTYENMRKNLTGKILIVPGGFGSMKEKMLGEEGKKAITDFVEEGGVYIGFCGGAGLALTHEGKGLGICPWGRGVYNTRLEHVVSGHIVSSLVSDKLLFNKTKQINNTDTTDNTDAASTIASSLSNTLEKNIPLPVWWPGRFQEPQQEQEPQQNPSQESSQTPQKSNKYLQADKDSVRVLARYKSMGEDLYVADMPLTKLPKTVFEDWQHLYGVTVLPHLLKNEPVIIAGTFGKGEYVLSYSHLETPDSPEANSLFAQILRSCLNRKNDSHTLEEQASITKQQEQSSQAFLAQEKLAQEKLAQEQSFYIKDGIHVYSQGFSEKNIFNTVYTPIWLSQAERAIHANPLLLELYSHLEELFALGVDLHLLFVRTTWLYGWHTSVPGSQLNALRVALLQSLFFKEVPKRADFLQEHGMDFAQKMRIFVHGAKAWLLARKLAEVMGVTLEKDTGASFEKAMENSSQQAKQGSVSKTILQEQRKELFGLHMRGGGLCGELIDWLNDYLFCVK